MVLITKRKEGGVEITLARKEMEKALRTTGCRITPQRKAVLDYLTSTDAHPSARQVYQEAKKTYPGISLATVYNTLDKLVKLGLVKVIDFEAMDNRHETNLTPHINLICKLCGKIQDFREDAPLQTKKVEEEVGFEVVDYRMEYYGKCAECRARKNKGK
jgi:Fur family peroxide stress response transcriptional regulator